MFSLTFTPSLYCGKSISFSRAFFFHVGILLPYHSFENQFYYFFDSNASDSCFFKCDYRQWRYRGHFVGVGVVIAVCLQLLKNLLY